MSKGSFISAITTHSSLIRDNYRYLYQQRKVQSNVWFSPNIIVICYNILIVGWQLCLCSVCSRLYNSRITSQGNNHDYVFSNI